MHLVVQRYVMPWTRGFAAQQTWTYSGRDDGEVCKDMPACRVTHGPLGPWHLVLHEVTGQSTGQAWA